MPRPRKAWLVSHTHWDREWYATFHTFRVRLAATIRRVLDQLETVPDYRHFMLDGQAILLEDYLAIHPEDADRIRTHVRAGRLAIGPWYILPDEFLVSGEALVRNALIGRQVCRVFGDPTPVGYMPDTFGHVAQIPQILRGCGLDTFVYWRGNGSEIDTLGLSFDWIGPDGSRVLALQQCGGYCNAAGLGHEEIWQAHTPRAVDAERAVAQVADIFEQMDARGGCEIALLNNGCDHFPPQADFPAILAALRKRWPQIEFQHGSLAACLADLRAAQPERRAFTGELLSGRLAHILSGIWSARMILKQQNAACQAMLAERWEPLAASHHFLHGLPYPGGLLAYAWKLLLQNQPHDSIGGCSIDRVHEDMLPRFAGVLETARDGLARQFEALAPHFARHGKDDDQVLLLVANPHAFRHSPVVERVLILPPECDAIDPLAVVDPDGREVASRIVDTWHVERFWGIDYRTQLDVRDQLAQFRTYRDAFGPRILKQPGDDGLIDRFVRVQFLAGDLPSVGQRAYRIVARPPAEPPPLPIAPVRRDGWKLENEHLAVTLHPDGTLDLLDRHGQRHYPGLHALVDQADRGDEYDFDPLDPDTPIGPPPAGSVRVEDATDLRATLVAETVMRLPARLAADRSARDAETVVCPVCVRVTLDAGARWVTVETEFENLAEDHRLRALFPAPLVTGQLISDGHFHTSIRPLRRSPGEDFVQPDPPTWPQQNFSAIADAAGGLTLLNDGLPEIEAWNEGARTTLALTLLRCVGWLSRDDLESRRRQSAGPVLATPGGQCRGHHRFRYALAPFVGPPDLADLVRNGQAWRCPPSTWQGTADHAARLADESLLELDADRVVLTAIKKHEQRDTLVLRMYALGDRGGGARLRFARPVRAAWRCNLLEDRAAPLSVDPAALRVELGPHEILTVEVALAGP